MKTTRIAASFALAGIAALAPAWAVSLAVTSPAQPLPEGGTNEVAPLAIESWSTGSASLVPLMAADMQASHVASIDAPADAPAGAVGKPIDDVAFVK